MKSIIENPTLYKTERRIDHIDLLKALAIYFVVVYHVGIFSSNIVRNSSGSTYFNLYLKSILSTCVPIFFFVNGLLLLNKKALEIQKHIQKILTILMLAVLWSLITLVALIYIRGEVLPLVDIAKGVWLLKPGWNDHLWFLFALVVIYVFHPLIHQVYHANKKAFCFFFACVMLFTFGNVLIENVATIISYYANRFTDVDFSFNYFAMSNPFTGSFGFSIGYFMLGGLAGGKFPSLPGNTKRKFTIMAAMVLLVSMLFLFFYAVIASLRSNQMWDIVWEGYDTIFTLINVVALYILSFRYVSAGWVGRFIKTVSTISLGIYFLHIIVKNITGPFYERLAYSNTPLANLAYAFVVLLCCLLLTLVFKKVPFVKRLFSI